ncbi:SMP-30/gluconolactonase/LRE family protein [Nocardia asteroides]|uniref:SMP-30/gluconolactonase/LRE family protein n=1 Tax=Nocardia asteroides TaxID=1824 RepID=UPI001E2A6FCF|nr:superoxide dismutase [Nocardia asteroides]UGT62486.1 superoxide dismutase [Nocardia asteroides]
MLSTLFRRSAVAACALAAVACGSTAAPDPVETAYVLPGERVYPEGIAADPRTGDTYVGSYATGAIYRAAPDAAEAEVFLPAGADGRATANGLKVDSAGRLWVTDSTAGVTVYDIASRRLLARFDVPGPQPRFVNDLAITPDGTAYLTDSVRGVVYRVTPDQLAAGGAELTVRFDLTGKLAPRAPDAFNINGIVADPAGNYLLVVDMIPGELYRIGLGDGDIRRVELHGGDVTNGDGLELRDDTLWVVQNMTNTISRWSVADDGATATKSGEITDAALRIPTTMARVGDRTLVVASQFDRGGPMGPGEPSRFEIVSVHGI